MSDYLYKQQSRPAAVIDAYGLPVSANTCSARKRLQRFMTAAAASAGGGDEGSQGPTTPASPQLELLTGHFEDVRCFCNPPADTPFLGMQAARSTTPRPTSNGAAATCATLTITMLCAQQLKL
jgi:hypothetical protein